MDELVGDYLLDLRRRNLASATIIRRRNCLQILTTWADPTTLRDLTTDDVDRFLDDRTRAPRTRYHWLSHLGCFYQWAADRHGWTNPTASIIRPRLPRLLPRPIPTDDLAVALACATPVMRAWLALAAYSGLRCAEIAGLDAADIQPDLVRVTGKGSHERMIPLHPFAYDAIRATAPPRAGPLWTPAPTPAAVSHRIAGHLRGLGVEATAHQLRHWFATELYRTTSDLRLVQELLGHASPSTTAIYTSWSRPHAQAAVHALAV